MTRGPERDRGDRVVRPLGHRVVAGNQPGDVGNLVQGNRLTGKLVQ